jgi:hypothetical protein
MMGGLYTRTIDSSSHNTITNYQASVLKKFALFKGTASQAAENSLFLLDGISVGVSLRQGRRKCEGF